MIIFLITFWFVRTTKAILFWIYLWQLKEYHIGRFLDHFRTHKGKTLLLNPLLFSKIVLFILLNFSLQIALYLIVLLYALEILQFVRALATKRFLGPIRTTNTSLLVGAGLVAQGIFLWVAYSFFGNILFQLLLAFDILLPFIVSAIVLLSQPVAVIVRNRIIQKAKEKRAHLKNLIVIGVTGSYGKTSTKEFLYTLLVEKFGRDKVVKTKEHQNSEVGVSRCILHDVNLEHRIFICEMGAYGRGGIRLLCDIAKPQIGVLTGINEQHLATFGSQENIISTKYELIESLPQNGIAFFNAKNMYCVELYEKTQGIRKFLYGQEAKTFGEENLLGAIAVAKVLGMNEQEISIAKLNIQSKLPGIQQQKGTNGLIIFSATYSANPTGVLGHLEYIKSLPGRKIIVMPCLIELGKESKEIHKKIGEKIAEVCDFAIITTKDRLKEIQKGAGGKAVFIEDPRKIFEKIKSIVSARDVVLLEGRVPSKIIELLQ